MVAIASIAAHALDRSYVGSVQSFDEAAGLGTIEIDDSSTFAFHCTAIADGSRTIAVGTEIICELRPGNLGVIEARAIRPRA